MGSYKSIVLRLLQVKKHSALGMGMTEITAIKHWYPVATIIYVYIKGKKYPLI